ncbi:hypothetical protein [Rhabdaerophilum sp. SD176]|uniref:hypothetical protein n=1 Tax=Rhabdaerophilum sp. SD176 TaxID=2983548 RepID=UPI0024DF95D7|nr:hypothetical protein [Rhabdaerophilum sp. SD176]
MRFAVLALLLCASEARAGSIEITRSCFGDFCLESREAFMAVAADPARHHYRIRFSRTQSMLYVQTGPEPKFPHCEPLCDVAEQAGEPRSRQAHTGRLVGRLVGPVPGCAGQPDRFVHLYVYDTSASPDWLTVVPNCPGIR